VRHREVIEIRLRPPGRVAARFYRQLGLAPPALAGDTFPWHARFIRLLPQCWRWLHRGYACAFGFFWLPCVLCGRLYGGHQAAGEVPDPTRGPGSGIAVCPQCVKDGKAVGYL